MVDRVGQEDSVEPDGVEPDARFTFANERTFLAWIRTSVALVVAGLAITQLLPPFPGIPGGRHIVGVPLIVLGFVLSLASYRRWEQNQRALRLGQPLPGSNLPRLLTVLVAVVALIAAVLVLVTR